MGPLAGLVDGWPARPQSQAGAPAARAPVACSGLAGVGRCSGRSTPLPPVPWRAPGAGNHDAQRPGGAPAPMPSVGCRRGHGLAGWGGRLRRARLIRQRAMRQGPGGRFLRPDRPRCKTAGTRGYSDSARVFCSSWSFRLGSECSACSSPSQGIWANGILKSLAKASYWLKQRDAPTDFGHYGFMHAGAVQSANPAGSQNCECTRAEPSDPSQLQLGVLGRVWQHRVVRPLAQDAIRESQ